MLMIPGATGDAGHFTGVAERLANEFTVITYDRRGNSRSPATTDRQAAAAIDRQADDAASLIKACGLEQAVVFGTSGGGVIALDLLVHHPEVVQGAIVHEPALLALLPPQDPGPMEPIFQLAQSDPHAALENFVRANSSDAAWEGLDAATRERVLGNAETLFGYELSQFIGYRPDDQALRAVNVPVKLLHSEKGAPFGPLVQAWLEQRLRVSGGTISGHHAPYLDTPEVMAEELRPLLCALSGQTGRSNRPTNGGNRE